MKLGLLVLGVAWAVLGRPAAGGHPQDVIWRSPSPDASGSMPLGNGAVALNAWMEPGGGLVFYVARGDAWSENGRLLKIGRIRITTDPPLVTEGFEQRLSLDDATMVVRCGTGDTAATVRLWVDANHPVVHASIESARPVTATAAIELWRLAPEPYPRGQTSDLLEDRSRPNGLREPVIVRPDLVMTDLPEGRIGWLHHNAVSVGPDRIARLQGLEDVLSARPDPLRHRTFGAVITAPSGARLDDTRLRTPLARSHRFDVYVHTAHPATPDAWATSIASIVDEVAARPFADRRAAHEQWWRAFWDRSWIDVTQREPVPFTIGNHHPVRIGVDQHGANRFAGEIGRLSIIARPSSDEALRGRAGRERTATTGPGPDVRFHTEAVGVAPVTIPGSAGWSFPGGLTIEAWIRPGDDPAGGRIVDTITPGGSDGLLLDTHPGRGLRLIVGDRTLQVRDVLPAHAWSHVAAVVDPEGGRLALLLDGVAVATQDLEVIDDAAVVSRGYALQRFIDACAGRGRYPIKFNGSLFTVPHEGAFGDADYRRWGPGYWWQNTRLPYLSMCTSGDFEMIRPLFRMYATDLMPVHVARTKRTTGSAGAYIPECIYFWGPIFTQTYGWTPIEDRGEDKLQESGWHKWEWIAGIELVWMMLDYYEHTMDEAFLRESLLPTARAILRFFDEHYGRDVRGRLVIHPAQALETWWDCTNPMPEVAGLQAVTARLLALPVGLVGPEMHAFLIGLRTSLPDLPTHEVGGVTMLAPAERFADKRNVENPELYAVFPFRLVAFEKERAALGVAALDHRWDRGHTGWRQDDLFMTHLGLAERARENLVARARATHAGSRFPAFWGPNYDWIPDQDHGGVLMRALQTMLIQTEGRTIHLLPAWPRGWDADFKVHAPERTTLTGRVRHGRLEALDVQPASRRADVVVHE